MGARGRVREETGRGGRRGGEEEEKEGEGEGKRRRRRRKEAG